MTNAIKAVYPETKIQQCIIHQIRNTTRFVSYKDIKALMGDLKRVYAAAEKEIALYEWESLRRKMDREIPKDCVIMGNKMAEMIRVF